MEAQNFSERLGILVKKYKSVRDLSLRLGISDGVLRAYLKGTSSPGLDIIIKISEETGCDLDWLILGKALEGRAKDCAQKNLNLNEEDFVYAPVAESRLSAGNGALVLEYEEPLDMISFRRPWVTRVATSAANLVAFFVEGDSMLPMLESGDLVLIDRGRTQPRTGAIFAVCVGGDLLQIKRLEVIGGVVRVIADNKNYPVAELPAEQVMVIGQVIWFCRELVRRR